MIAKFMIPLLLGFSGYVLWFSWAWFPLAVCLQIFAVLLLLRDTWDCGKTFIRTSHPVVRVLFGVLALLYMIPIFLPETGFDALWYHLPITEVFAQTHTIAHIPELYQSAMPRLGSFMFVPSYVIGGVFGVKIFVYSISLAAVSWVFLIARRWFPPDKATFVTLCVWSFHVFGWQSSSAYVDQVRFLFEIAAICLVIHKVRTRLFLTMIALLFGFALSTKLLTLFFLPGFFLWLVYEYGLKMAVAITMVSLGVAAPWYLQAYQWTGNPVYPLFQQLNGQEQLMHAGASSLWVWGVQQLAKLPLLPFYLATNVESYTSPLFVLGYLGMFIKKIIWKPLYVYVLHAGVILLLLPPFSFRYAWSAMIILFLLFAKQYVDVFAKKKIAIMVFICVGMSGVLFQMVTRTTFLVSVFPVLSGKIPNEVYIRQHITPLSRGPFERWYGGYWRSYRYNHPSDE